MQLLMPLQRFLAIHRKQVEATFFTAELLIIIVWLFVVFRIVSEFGAMFKFMYELGLVFGKAGAVFYIITLLPGIITRLQLLPKYTQPLSSLVLPFRRHFGILMFLSVFVHLSFTTFLPHFGLGGFEQFSMPSLMSFQVMGLVGWLSLLPLWLTSNDFSQKRLGKYWKQLHRLTYLALFFIFMHVALQKLLWTYIVGPVLLLEAVSWIVYRRREYLKGKTAVIHSKDTINSPADAMPSKAQEVPITSVINDPKL